MPARRRLGRPPLDPRSPSVSVHLKLSPQLYDAVYREAARQRVTMPEVLRRQLRIELKRGAGSE